MISLCSVFRRDLSFKHDEIVHVAHNRVRHIGPLQNGRAGQDTLAKNWLVRLPMGSPRLQPAMPDNFFSDGEQRLILDFSAKYSEQNVMVH